MYRLIAYSNGEFRFALPEDNGLTNRFTILIGPNGSGKSRLFRQLSEEARKDPVREDSAGNRIGIGHPTATYGVSNLVTDSFPFETSSTGAYRYLGIRQTTNSTSTGSLKDATVQSIVMCMRAEWRQLALVSAIELMGFDKMRTSVRHGSLSRIDRERFTRNLQTSRAYGFALDMSDASALFDDLIRLRDSLPSRKSRDDNAETTLEALQAMSRKYNFETSSLLRAAKRHGFVDIEVEVHSSRDWTRVDDLSSGQVLLLSMVARIAAFIEPSSLVLVDEPETGLHPNWQSELVPLLRRALPEQLGCHIFIATHSPHLVADGSDVLVPSETWGHFEDFPDPFYGRSIENLLYRVFGARVSGNSLVEDDLTLLATFVSNSAHVSLERASGAVQRLTAIAGPDTSVLNDVLQQVSQKLDGLI